VGTKLAAVFDSKAVRAAFEGLIHNSFSERYVRASATAKVRTARLPIL
jgi:hypothetical protein